LSSIVACPLLSSKTTKGKQQLKQPTANPKLLPAMM
jgi:hypothetical protein